MKTEMAKAPLSAKGTKVKVKIELSSEINISPFIARQKANVFLLTHLGNLVWAHEPKLSMSKGGVRWIVPIHYTIPNHSSTQVGELAIDVNNGEVILMDSIPPSLEEIENHVNALYQSSIASPAS